MRIKDVSVQIKAGPEDGLEDGEFIVYPSTFTRTPDSYGDVVAKGAFLDTIKAWEDSGNSLPGLYGHRLDDPDFFVAGASEMGEDDHERLREPARLPLGGMGYCPHLTPNLPRTQRPRRACPCESKTYQSRSRQAPRTG